MLSITAVQKKIAERYRWGATPLAEYERKLPSVAAAAAAAAAAILFLYSTYPCHYSHIMLLCTHIH